MSICLRRRDFIAGLGGAAASWPLAARAQQPGLPVIGLLAGVSAARYAGRVAGFHRGLSETGYVEAADEKAAIEAAAREFKIADALRDRIVARRDE